MKKIVETLEGFASVIYKLQRSDRDVNMAVGGMTGEGKTTFLYHLMQAHCTVAVQKWTMQDNMTWSRKEMLKWIDGEKDSKKEKGLKIGQLPEYSGILADELFQMFYRRLWFDSEQIDAISTFNMCRDRHLFVAGNIPDFWDLDPAFMSRIRFLVYIPQRGIAWVFEQENNPFCRDKWNTQENKKLFRKKKGNPFSCPNFVCEIHFPDWQPREKRDYLAIRNEKRVASIAENKSEKQERYKDVKGQRDRLIRLCFLENKKLKIRTVSELIDMSKEAVRLIKEGVR